MKPRLEDLVVGDIWQAVGDSEYTFEVVREGRIRWAGRLMSGEFDVKNDVKWTFDYINITPEVVIMKRLLKSYEAE